MRDLFDAAWRNKDAAFTRQLDPRTRRGRGFHPEQEGRNRAHGSVIERELHTADLRLTTGLI